MDYGEVLLARGVMIRWTVGVRGGFLHCCPALSIPSLLSWPAARLFCAWLRGGLSSTITYYEISTKWQKLELFVTSHSNCPWHWIEIQGAGKYRKDIVLFRSLNSQAFCSLQSIIQSPQLVRVSTGPEQCHRFEVCWLIYLPRAD